MSIRDFLLYHIVKEVVKNVFFNVMGFAPAL